ncbi:hypothetical protein [Piscibacillus halophilus]|uniref:hypothetical protein n=1 Tax=Piscibacillus halophilus TaxID=571933 RepID=UPI001589972F|nr:hypothetical protein [Piscibacillus halophilus]
MNLNQLKKEVEGYINQSHDLTVEYRKTEADLLDKVDKQLRGKKEVRNELDEKKAKMNDLLTTKANDLQDKIERVKANELAKIEETTEQVTADTLAELNLLEQLDLTGQDIDQYINKFKRTPLAMRKLQEISKDKGLMNQFPPTRQEYLNVILGRMNTSIDRFRIPNTSSHEVKLEMLKDGAIRSLNEDVEAYESL